MRHAREDYNRFQDPEFKIPNDEPVFLFRGQDKFAPRVLRNYAYTLIEAKEYEVAKLIFEWADEMDKWQAIKGSKIVDLPEDGK